MAYVGLDGGKTLFSGGGWLGFVRPLDDRFCHSNWGKVYDGINRLDMKSFCLLNRMCL